MADQTEKNRKRKAIIVTVAFHAIAIVLFLIFGLTQPNPLPEEQGASIEFGWDDAASGNFVADVQTPDPAPQQAQEQTPQPETVEETPVDDVVTDETSEIAIPKVEEKPKPKPKPKDPQPDPKPVEEPKPTIDDKLKGALESLKNSSEGGGGSKGDQEGEGVQGDPKGTTGSGALGGGSGSWQLDGRSMLPGYGTKIKTTTEEGIVTLNIWVDRNGKVTKVQPNLRESNTTSQYLINLATNDVLNNFKYNGDPKASIEQRGKVRYDFRLK